MIINLYIIIKIPKFHGSFNGDSKLHNYNWGIQDLDEPQTMCMPQVLSGQRDICWVPGADYEAKPTLLSPGPCLLLLSAPCLFWATLHIIQEGLKYQALPASSPVHLSHPQNSYLRSEFLSEGQAPHSPVGKMACFTVRVHSPTFGPNWKRR